MAVTAGRSDMLRSERIAGGILPRVLNSFDMVAIFIAIVLWVINAAPLTAAGPAAYIYWILGFVTFLVPGAIVTGQLGLMFPGEGSIYVWTTKAFGDFMGFLAGFCSWWPGILVLIASSDAVVTLIQKLGTIFGVTTLLSEPGEEGLVIILVITFSFLLSILRFRVTQNLVNIIFLTYGGAILLIGLAGLLWLLTGHRSTTDFSLQTGTWQLNSNNYTFYGLVILALLGVEVPLNMGVEIKDARSITRYLLWGSVVVIVSYLLTSFGIMVIVPLKDQTATTSMVEAVRRGFGPISAFLAALVDLILIGFFLFVTTVYNYSFARLIFVSGLDRRLPALMSKVNTNKIPWIAVLVQSVIAALLAVIIFIVVPVFLPALTLGGISTAVYNIVQASTTVIWCISMAILFVDVIIIRHKYRTAFARSRFAPDWVFYLCSAIGTFASICGIYVLFTSPWTTLIPLIVWNYCIIGIVLVSLVVAVVVFYVGRRTIQSDISDEDIIAEVTR